ncbi:MAG: phage holin family protein [Chitinophagaceae bacterium]|jgi:hypothetical protein|nr:phage holin family protein [Chitinophagaceae bacterium]
MKIIFRKIVEYIAHSSIGAKTTILFSSFFSMLIPIRKLAALVFLFIAIDFVSGSFVAKRERKEGFMTKKFYRTLWKLAGAEIAISLALFLDDSILSFLPHMFLPNIFAGFFCGADIWSILANFAILSNAPAFNLIRKFGKAEIMSKLKINFDEKELNNEKQTE